MGKEELSFDRTVLWLEASKCHASVLVHAIVCHRSSSHSCRLPVGQRSFCKPVPIVGQRTPFLELLETAKEVPDGFNGGSRTLGAGPVRIEALQEIGDLVLDSGMIRSDRGFAVLGLWMKSAGEETRGEDAIAVDVTDEDGVVWAERSPALKQLESQVRAGDVPLHGRVGRVMVDVHDSSALVPPSSGYSIPCLGPLDVEVCGVDSTGDSELLDEGEQLLGRLSTVFGNYVDPYSHGPPLRGVAS
jgi:hypothetical protein